MYVCIFTLSVDHTLQLAWQRYERVYECPWLKDRSMDLLVTFRCELGTYLFCGFFKFLFSYHPAPAHENCGLFLKQKCSVFLAIEESMAPYPTFLRESCFFRWMEKVEAFWMMWRKKKKYFTGDPDQNLLKYGQEVQRNICE